MEPVEIPFRRLQDVVDVSITAADPARTEWLHDLISSSAPFEKKELKEESLLMERELILRDQDTEFAIVRQEENVKVTEFLLAYFFPEVPIGKVVDMDVDSEVRPWIFDFIHLILTTNPSTSIQFRQRSTGRIWAVAINVIENDATTASPDLADFVHPHRHPKMYMNLTFLEELSAVLPPSPGSDKLLNIFMVAVDPNYGRRGLGSNLIRLSVQLAAQLGIKTVVSQAVNHYAIKSLEKCGFRSVKQLLYSQFVYHGDTPLVNDGVHQRAKYLVLQL